MSENGNEPNTTPTPPAGNEPKTVEQLPEWAQKIISDARNEAANYRTRLRDAKSEVRSEVEAEFQKKIDELTGTVQAKDDDLLNANLQRMKLETALNLGVPGDRAVKFAERLRGSTAEELEADAKAALEVFGLPQGNTRATDSSQGLGNDGPKETADIWGEFITKRLSH